LLLCFSTSVAAVGTLKAIVVSDVEKVVIVAAAAIAVVHVAAQVLVQVVAAAVADIVVATRLSYDTAVVQVVVVAAAAAAGVATTRVPHETAVLLDLAVVARARLVWARGDNLVAGDGDGVGLLLLLLLLPPVGDPDAVEDGAGEVRRVDDLVVVHDPAAGFALLWPVVVGQAVALVRDLQPGGARAGPAAAGEDEAGGLAPLPVPRAADAVLPGVDGAGGPLPGLRAARAPEEEGVVAVGVAVAAHELPRRAAAGVGVDDGVPVGVGEPDGAWEEVVRHDVGVRRVELVRRRQVEAEPIRLHLRPSSLSWFLVRVGRRTSAGFDLRRWPAASTWLSTCSTRILNSDSCRRQGLLPVLIYMDGLLSF
jgi:hypothetical protein